ncbi:ATP-binding protein [uncultured Adlercreutzia sp.]|uniref:ATP-binding protein n=1 Tax=uncultured Adlercreutzia sp. TaxID=875803 RepID=UPI0025E2485D|nr:ATP-binding protein [uncultured Adlercreutzia sp.]
MHAVKVDIRKIIAVALAIAAVFLVVVLAVGQYYLGSISSLVRNTTTTSVMEVATARARYLDECLTADEDSVMSLAHYVAHSDDTEKIAQIRDFLAVHGAATAWVREKDGEVWCSSDEADLYPADREEELFGPALEGHTGISEMYVGHAGEKRILFYTPLLAPGHEDGATGDISAADTVGGLYVSFPADELQNSYGTVYTDSGETYVVDASGTIVLDANRGTAEAEQGSLSALLADGGEVDVAPLLADVAARRAGSLVLGSGEAARFAFTTPLEAKPGWSLVTVLPLSLVERDGASIVGLAQQMVAVLGLAVAGAVGALLGLLSYRNRRERERERYVQSLYQAIGENIDTAIVIVDAESREVEAVFENIQGIMGVPAREFFVIDAESANEAYAKVAAIVHSGAPEGRGLWEFQCENPALGRAQWLRMTSHGVALGGADKVIFTVTDVTGDHDIRAELERSAAAEKEANRAKSSFLSSMSHDIRTPMNAILGFSTLIDRDAADEAAVRDYNRKIATSGQHLLGLINDVLDMSKIEAGKTTLAAERFSLTDVVESVEAMMRQQTDAKRQAFTVEVHGVAHPALVGDEGRLRQILMNVLSNAMKYTPEEGEILFRIDGSDKRRGELQHLRIIVRDSGIGMAPEYLATIFDSFSREDSERTSKIEGTGLGMAITKNLVELMGGTISVESELGRGSTFIIDLDFPPAPEGEGEEGGSRGPVDVDAVLSGRHFLVAEDNELNAEIVAAILDMHGATCDIAENGQVAVEKFTAAPAGTYDLVFLDVQMPVMDGHAAARAIRALKRPDAAAMPLVAMTANAFAEDVRLAKEAGMNAHVAKPLDIQALARVVADLV